MPKAHDVEVDIKAEHRKAVIAGKTSVPFQKLVQLILQRKVMGLFKKWGDEPIIVSSELLTGLASAPQDNQENREHLVLVTLGVGVLAGVFVMAIVQVALTPWEIYLKEKELLLIAGTLLGLTVLTAALARVKRKNRSQKIADTMEKVAGLLSK